MVKEWIQKVFNVQYDQFFKELADKFFGPTGAEVIAWLCLITSTFLILRRRVTSIGVIVLLYLIAFFFAYAPSLYRLLR